MKGKPASIDMLNKLLAVGLKCMLVLLIPVLPAIKLYED